VSDVLNLENDKRQTTNDKQNERALWLPNNNERTPYFKPLEDHPELIIDNTKQLQHVSRA